jgi:archaeal cell division control protein 6
MQSGSREILLDADVLSDDHLPPEIHARASHIQEIATCIRPMTEGRKPVNCWLYGNPGVGKTATARFILQKLYEETGIRFIHVNCWQNPTFFSVLERIATELRMLGADKLSTSFKLERLRKHLSRERLLIILDEIDQCPPKERHAILYNLSDLPTVGLICACNSEHTYFSLEERVKSRLNPARFLFGEYTTQELFDILIQRAQWGLVTNSYSDNLLRMIAQLASGDARLAIQTLKNAACLAEKEGCGTIKDSHVRRAWNSAKDLKVSYLLRKLTDHHRLLYELIAGTAVILSGDLWRLYLKTCNERRIRPIAVRTFSDYCNKLVELALVRAKRAPIQGKVREFSTLQ